MAIAAVTKVETRLCGNCKKDIPAANFIIHEIHCSRNIEVCSYCSESIPKSEMKNHIESEHMQVTCKCRMKMENGLLKDHEASACPLRPALCQFCDIPLTFNKLQDHEVYCGARTETCGGCGHNVMVKDLKEHPRVCGQEVKQERGRRAVPRFEGEDGGVRTRLRSEDYLDQLERNQTTHSSLYDEWNADLDYVLALSLQNENNPPNNTADEIPSGCWESYYTKESVPSSACLRERDKANIFSRDSLASFSTTNCTKRDEIIMLPCEFCEELYPAEDLILHQTGCNPASAFASFSKRSSSPNPWDYDGLRALGSKSCRSLFSSQSRAVWEADNMIPCEFCGIQLEEETLFHHQHHCDLRPASPTASFKPQQLQPPHPNPGRRDSPELARRRVRHQGDVSPWCAEGLGQQRLSCPAGGTKLLNATSNARTAPVSSSARASDAPDLRGKPRKASGNEGRLKSRSAGGSASGTMPRERPAQNSHSEAFRPSFSRTPSQPSTISGGRSLRMADGPVGFRRRSSQAKAQSPAPAHPEK